MNKENEKIAIGILAYNVSKYIDNVIDELQDMNLHIYVINDSSSDGTEKKLEKYKEKSNVTEKNCNKNIQYY